uniref:Putative secreted peptide n=1 Tax=Anopheles braziliensis TaxID=58242 RepID=A0A2M3ZPE2_9DIPT
MMDECGRGALIISTVLYSFALCGASQHRTSTRCNNVQPNECIRSSLEPPQGIDYITDPPLLHHHHPYDTRRIGTSR